jgi:hypothetical protein
VPKRNHPRAGINLRPVCISPPEGTFRYGEQPGRIYFSPCRSCYNLAASTTPSRFSTEGCL